MARKITLGVIALLLVAGIYIAFEISNAFHDLSIDTDRAITKNGDRDQDKEQPNKDRPKDTNDFYALVIGLDARGDSLTLNTDTILVAHILEDGKGVKLISVPRDLKVHNSQQKPAKINAIFAEGYMYARTEGRKNPDLLSGRTINVGGWQLAEEYISSGMVTLRSKVEEVLDIDVIDYTFIVNFDTVTTLVDLVGGVEVDIKRSMHWDDSADGTSIHFEPGVQTLNGEEALNYARFRRDNRGGNYDSSDFDRGLRQQEVISAIVDELSSWSSLTKLNRIIDAVTDNVKTDMERAKMISLARQMYGKIKSDQIETIPLPSYWQNPYAYVDDDDMERVKRQFHSLQLGSSDDDESAAGETENESEPQVNTTEEIVQDNDKHVASNVVQNVYGNEM